MTEVSPEQRFTIWYRDIFKHLEETKEIRDGNGALVALTAALPLYERWVKAEIALDTTKNQPGVIASDLGFANAEEAKKFWNVFRDGLCHTGSFFEHSDKSKDPARGWNLPKVGLDARYPDLPRYDKDSAGNDVILVNPWGFVRHILKKYEGRPDLIRCVDAPLIPLRYG